MKRPLTHFPCHPDDFTVRIEPAGVTLQASAGEDLLSAAHRQGLAVRWACRNGVCDLCHAGLLRGSVYNSRTNQQQVPSDLTTDVLLCRVQARQDCTLEIGDLMAAGKILTLSRIARVMQVRPLSAQVFQVQLLLPSVRDAAFHAGQYLSIDLPGAEPAFFSIACAPGERTLELHIQAEADWGSAQQIIQTLQTQSSVRVTLPMGEACLAATNPEPLLLVAAGTGFAQMKSIIEYLAKCQPCPDISLYWGVRTAADLYLPQLPLQWQSQLPGFRYQPVIADTSDSDWPGHHDQLVEAILAQGHDWTRTRVLASGSPAMVYTLMDALMAAGLPATAFASDVLQYAPRG